MPYWYEDLAYDNEVWKSRSTIREKVKGKDYSAIRGVLKWYDTSCRLPRLYSNEYIVYSPSWGQFIRG